MIDLYNLLEEKINQDNKYRQYIKLNNVEKQSVKFQKFNEDFNYKKKKKKFNWHKNKEFKKSVNYYN